MIMQALSRGRAGRLNLELPCDHEGLRFLDAEIARGNLDWEEHRRPDVVDTPAYAAKQSLLGEPCNANSCTLSLSNL